MDVDVAIVGAGPAGLTAARDLAIRGYKVTVFEELSEPGGMLRWAIPAYRLPRNILAREIDDVRALGVDIQCNTRVGKDLPWRKVAAEHDVVGGVDADYDCWKFAALRFVDGNRVGWG